MHTPHPSAITDKDCLSSFIVLTSLLKLYCSKWWELYTSFPAPCKQTFFSMFISFSVRELFSLDHITDSLSENFQFYTMLHYWHLSLSKKSCVPVSVFCIFIHYGGLVLLSWWVSFECVGSVIAIFNGRALILLSVTFWGWSFSSITWGGSCSLLIACKRKSMYTLTLIETPGTNIT